MFIVLGSLVVSSALDVLDHNLFDHFVLSVDISSGHDLEVAGFAISLLRDELVAVLLEHLFDFASVGGIFTGENKK